MLSLLPVRGNQKKKRKQEVRLVLWSRQEVPFKPWCWQHNFNSDQQKSLKDKCASGKQQAIGIRPQLGMDSMHIDERGKVHFAEAAHTLGATIELEQPDFHPEFDQRTKSWTVSWKMSGDQPPEKLYNRVPEYTIPEWARAEYDEELQNWIDNGWLVPYPEDKLAPSKGLILLIAVIQQNKQKVRPVLDYRDLNDHVDPFTARADICTEKLREWRRAGSNVSVLDHQSLWSYQTVLFKRRRYCLTRMRFGLNVTLSIMQKIVDAILMKDKHIQRATSAYIDDNIVPMAHVKEHLYSFGLLSKEPERLQDGAWVLGLQVWGEDNSLYWRRWNKIPDMPRVVMRQNIFSLCGKLVGHLPVGGWLRVAVAFIKRKASDVTTGWDDKIDDAPLNPMIKEVITRVHKEDPAWGRWCIDDQTLCVWVNASSLATGVSLVYDGAVVEDACWLRPGKDSQHINLAELDAIIKGINLAILWKTITLHLFTDSACVHKWISDTLTGKAKVWTKAASEMLIRRWLDTIIKLVKEYALSMNVSLVKSSQNKADRLTRVSQRWLDAIKRNTESVQPACTASVSSFGLHQIKIVHRQSSHLGVQQTLYFVRQIALEVSKAAMKTIIREYEKCQSIDPAPMHWSKGALNVKQTWHQVAMNITHCNRAHFSMVINCGPTRFAICDIFLDKMRWV